MWRFEHASHWDCFAGAFRSDSSVNPPLTRAASKVLGFSYSGRRGPETLGAASDGTATSGCDNINFDRRLAKVEKHCKSLDWSNGTIGQILHCYLALTWERVP